jgi:hypothetical protein
MTSTIFKFFDFFIKDTECQLFAVNKVLPVRGWLPLMGITVPFTLTPGEFFALIKERVSIEKAIELINERIEGLAARDSEGRGVFA